jgi:2-methylcitrate dehydratase
MTELEELAAFVGRAQLGDLGQQALEQLKIGVLDAICVAVAALTAPPVVAIGALWTSLAAVALQRASVG